MVSSIAFIVVLIVCVLMGILFWALPDKAIQWQISFYRMIGWRIEPISMEREVRNVQGAGCFMACLGVCAFALFWNMNWVIKYLIKLV